MDFYSNVGTTDIVGKFFNPIVTTLSFDELWEDYYATNEPINISNSVLFSVPKDIEGNDLRYEGSIWITDINGYLYPMTPTFNRIIELEKKLNYFTNDTFTKITSISWIDKNPSGSSIITSTNPLKTSTKQIEIKYENNTFEYVSINKVSLFTFAVYVKTDDDTYVNTSTYWYTNPGEYYIKAIIPAYKSESGKDLYTDSYLKWTIKNANDNTPSNPDDNTPSNPDDTSTIYYWYAGTTLPTASNISTIARGSLTSKPSWTESNQQDCTVTNNTGASSYVYYCFPANWNIQLYDVNNFNIGLASEPSFTYNNVEYKVERLGRKQVADGLIPLFARCGNSSQDIEPQDPEPQNPEPQDPEPQNPEQVFYWYAGTTLPDESNISTITRGSLTSKPSWTTSNQQDCTVINDTGDSAYVYYCFPADWNVQFYDGNNFNVGLASESSFTYNNIEYKVERLGRKQVAGATIPLFARC